jgi:hypothetical protein
MTTGGTVRMKYTDQVSEDIQNGVRKHWRYMRSANGRREKTGGNSSR